MLGYGMPTSQDSQPTLTTSGNTSKHESTMNNVTHEEAHVLE